MRAKLVTIAMLLLVITVFMGCSNETIKLDATSPVATDPGAPGLPPVASMQFNFDLFDTQKTLGISLDEAEISAASRFQWNWLNAVVRMAFLNLIVAEVVVPPSIAFYAAVNTIPSYVGDNTFMWVYTWFESPNHEIEIRLRGTIVDDSIEWEMQITDDQANPPLDQATWFTGRSHMIEDRGHWVLNNLEDGEELESIRIDWEVDGLNHKELSLEIIEAGDDNYGDTLIYLQQGVIITVEYYDASEDITADITWNEQSGAGSLQVPDYNDGERACWDENQIDIECPADNPS